MPTSAAPIALFVYNRLDHTRRTLDALAANALADQSDLMVFCDGARAVHDADQVGAVRDLVKLARGFRSVSVVERDANLGLARSIISGVTEVLAKRERIIVVEDDLVTSPHFLSYMNEALEQYADDARVASIHGYVYPVDRRLPETFFMRGADCWGWGTWRDRWSLFIADGAKLLAELRSHGLTDAFDMAGAFSNVRMLEGQIAGTNNSWAIRWHASAFLANKLTLYPGQSLVHNIGNDGSGTHTGTYSTYDNQLRDTRVAVGGIAVEESAEGRRAFAEFGRRNKLGMSVPRRVLRAIQRIFGAA